MRFHMLVQLGLTVEHFRTVAALEIFVVHVFDMVFHSLKTDLVNCAQSRVAGEMFSRIRIRPKIFYGSGSGSWTNLDKN